MVTKISLGSSSPKFSKVQDWVKKITTQRTTVKEPEKAPQAPLAKAEFIKLVSKDTFETNKLHEFCAECLSLMPKELAGEPKAKELQQKINSFTNDINKVRREATKQVFENVDLPTEAKERLISTRLSLARYEATKTIKKMLSEYATKLEKDPKTAKFSEIVRDLEVVMRALSKQCKAEAALQAIKAHEFFEKKHKLNIFEDSLPGTTTHQSFTLVGRLGIGAGIANLTGQASVTGGGGGTSESTITQEPEGSFIATRNINLGPAARAQASTPLSIGEISTSASASRSYSSNQYRANDVHTLVHHQAVQSSNAQKQIAIKQKIFTLTAPIKNFVREKLLDLNQIDPNQPIYATRKTLAGAIGTEQILQRTLSKYGTDISKHNKLSVLDIDPPSQGPTAASEPGTKKPRHNPIKTTIYSGKISAQTGLKLGTAQTAGYEFDVQNRVADTASGIVTPANALTASLLTSSVLPSVEATANATLKRQISRFDGTLLKPTHELLSTAHTKDYATSFNTAKSLHTAWQIQTTTALPLHLRTIDNLFKSANLSFDSAHLMTHIENANNALTDMHQQYAEFEEAASLLVNLTHQSVDFKSPYYKKMYNEAVSQIKRHQFDTDITFAEIPKSELASYGDTTVAKPSPDKVQEALGKIWDSYSSALGIAEIATLGPLKNKSIDAQPELKAEVDLFIKQYDQFAKKLANPTLPFSADELYRHASITSPHISESTSTTHETTSRVVANLGAGLNGLLKTKPLKYVLHHHDYKLTTPAKTTSAFEKHPIEVDTYGTNSATFSDKNWETKLKKDIASLPEEDQKSLITAARAFAMRQTYTPHPTLTSKPVQITVTRSQGQLQSITIAQQDKNGFDAHPTFPVSGAEPFFAGVDATLDINKTKVVNRMIGPELNQNIKELKFLESYGIDKSIVKQNIELDEQNKLNLQNQLSPFFNDAAKNSKIRETYFGLNAIGDLLKNFSEIKKQEKVNVDKNGEFELRGFNCFNNNVAQTYFEKKSAESLSSKRVLTPHSNEAQDIFQTIGIDAARVKALLDSPSPGDQTKTVEEFLKTANSSERMQFFQKEKTGVALFGAYILILNTAKDIKDVLTKNDIQLSDSMQKLISSKK